MEQQGTLSLAVGHRSTEPDDGLAIDLRRADIETALGSAEDGLVELLLDLEAREVDGGATRRQTLTVGCTLADLERMLEDASDSVRVSFDAEALARAIDPDIEAHGLREKMAVLAVVVATTGAAAGGAQAMPTLGGQSGVSGGATVTSTGDTAADSLERVRRAHRAIRGGYARKPERCRSGVYRRTGATCRAGAARLVPRRPSERPSHGADGGDRARA